MDGYDLKEEMSEREQRERRRRRKVAEASCCYIKRLISHLVIVVGSLFTPTSALLATVLYCAGGALLATLLFVATHNIRNKNENRKNGV